jgi:hypothetical protein
VGFEWDPFHWSWDGVAYRPVRGHWLFVHPEHEHHHWHGGHWYRSERNWFYQTGFWA